MRQAVFQGLKMKSLLNNGLGYPQKRLHTMQEWRDIKGFDGYQVSKDGAIRSHNKVTYTDAHGARHWKDRILKQKIGKDGRARVCLWANGKEKTLLVHRIMAIAFLGDPQNEKMTVNHKDGNPLNNTIKNIEWVTLKDNIRYGFENGQYSSVKEICIKGEDGAIYSFYSNSACSRFLGRSHSYIYSMKNSKFLRNKNGKVFEVV